MTVFLPVHVLAGLLITLALLSHHSFSTEQTLQINLDLGSVEGIVYPFNAPIVANFSTGYNLASMVPCPTPQFAQRFYLAKDERFSAVNGAVMSVMNPPDELVLWRYFFLDEDRFSKINQGPISDCGFPGCWNPTTARVSSPCLSAPNEGNWSMIVLCHGVYINNTIQESRQCTAANPCPPQDCLVSNWTSWSGCNVWCGEGNQTSSRQINLGPYYGGQECPTNLTQSQPCTGTICFTPKPKTNLPYQLNPAYGVNIALTIATFVFAMGLIVFYRVRYYDERAHWGNLEYLRIIVPHWPRVHPTILFLFRLFAVLFLLITLSVYMIGSRQSAWLYYHTWVGILTTIYLAVSIAVSARELFNFYWHGYFTISAEERVGFLGRMLVILLEIALTGVLAESILFWTVILPAGGSNADLSKFVFSFWNWSFHLGTPLIVLIELMANDLPFLPPHAVLTLVLPSLHPPVVWLANAFIKPGWIPFPLYNVSRWDSLGLYGGLLVAHIAVFFLVVLLQNLKLRMYAGNASLRYAAPPVDQETEPLNFNVDLDLEEEEPAKLVSSEDDDLVYDLNIKLDDEDLAQ